MHRPLPSITERCFLSPRNSDCGGRAYDIVSRKAARRGCCPSCEDQNELEITVVDYKRACRRVQRARHRRHRNKSGSCDRRVGGNWRPTQQRRIAGRDELRLALARGGRFTSPTAFEAPYVYGSWPNRFDPFECAAIVGRNVRLRTAPRLDAPVITLVAAKPQHPLTSVRTPRPYDSLSVTPVT